MNAQRVTPGAGAIVKQEAGATQMEVRSDQNVAAVAAQAEAMVKARWALAKMNPRDIELVRTAVLKDCRRPGFADAAIYEKPVGGGKSIEGASVRFAEALMRHMGNLLVEATVVSDDREKRIVQVSVTDLETVSTDSVQVAIEKRVERRGDKSGRPPKDRIVLAERTNTYGEKIFIVEATEDEMLNKTNAAISKARRNKILEMAPADVVEEALALCRETVKKADAADPDAAKRKVIDGFAGVGVKASDLRAWLGHDLDVISPKEIDELRKMFLAIRDGETTWASFMAEKTGPGVDPKTGEVKAPPTAPAAEPPARTEPVQTFAPGSPEAAAEALRARMRAAVAENNPTALTALAAEVKGLPEDLHMELLAVYQECKNALKAKAAR